MLSGLTLDSAYGFGAATEAAGFYAELVETLFAEAGAREGS
mgnify:CR=1 FL=1